MKKSLPIGFLMKKVTKLLLNKIPRPMLIKMSIWARPLIYQFFKGDTFLILLTENLTVNFFLTDTEVSVKMPFSRNVSLERHRQMWLYLQNETDFFIKNYKVLHIAPEQEF
jgi:hypothetical protein